MAPFGLSLMGPPYSEAQLIGLAYAFEQATRAHAAEASRRSRKPRPNKDRHDEARCALTTCASVAFGR
jgi:hypothetical protein